MINAQALDWNEGGTLAVRMRQSYKPTQTYMASRRELAVWKLFAAEDAGLELTLLHLGTTARLRLPGTHLMGIDNAAHTFTSQSAREQMLSQITRHLQARFPTP